MLGVKRLQIKVFRGTTVREVKVQEGLSVKGEGFKC